MLQGLNTLNGEKNALKLDEKLKKKYPNIQIFRVCNPHRTMFDIKQLFI